MARNPLDRCDDFLDRLFDGIVGLADRIPAAPAAQAPAFHKWWIVTNNLTTGLVITNPQRCVVIAPIGWNRFVGLTLDELLTQTRAHASPLPGPHPEPRELTR